MTRTAQSLDGGTATIPSVEHVIKKRHHNRRRLRFMALILVVTGSVFVVWGCFTVLIIDYDWWALMQLASIGAGFILPALPLWLLDDRIGRALVPMPRRECPGCRYDLTALERPICPECGQALPAAYVRHSQVVDD